MIIILTLLAIATLCGLTWYLTRPPKPEALLEQQRLEAQRQLIRELQLAEEYEMQAAVHRVRAASYEGRVKRLRLACHPQAGTSAFRIYPAGAAELLSERLLKEAEATLQVDEYRQHVEKETSRLLAAGKVPPDLRAKWAEGSLDHFALGRALEQRGLIPSDPH